MGWKTFHWECQESWDPVLASVNGSSYCKRPKGLKWFSSNIGLRHIRHLWARIPICNPRECFDSVAALRPVESLMLWRSVRASS